MKNGFIIRNIHLNCVGRRFENDKNSSNYKSNLPAYIGETFNCSEYFNRNINLVVNYFDFYP